MSDEWSGRIRAALRVTYNYNMLMRLRIAGIDEAVGASNNPVSGGDGDRAARTVALFLKDGRRIANCRTQSRFSVRCCAIVCTAAPRWPVTQSMTSKAY